MVSANLIKVLAAFVAGVVIALGSALVYVRATDKNPEPEVSSSLTPDEVNRSQTPSDPIQAAGQDAARNSVRKAGRMPISRRDPLTSLGHKFRHNDDPEKEAAQHAESAHLPSVADNPYHPDSNPAPALAVPQIPAVEPGHPLPVQAESNPPRRTPRSITLPPGTNLVIRLGETLSTDHNYSGDAFRASLEAPIIMNGAVIAEKGSKVLGRIVNVQKAGRVRGVSGLDLTLAEINTTDGQRVPIQTGSFDKRGSTARGSDAAKVGGGAALGAIIGAIAGGGKGASIGAGIGGAAGVGDVLLTHGQPAVIQNESQLTFRLAEPVTITERLNY